MATRRTPEGTVFDHGAQYFTARDLRFSAMIEAWQQAGVAAPWLGRIVSLEGGGMRESEPLTRYVGTPGMTAIAKHLASEQQVTLGARIVAPERRGALWRLADETGQEQGEFDLVLVAVPPEQAAPLVATSSLLSREVTQVLMRPCWAVMATFNAPVNASFDGAFVHDSPLSWIARNNSKPERAPQPETWVLHASSDWSVANLERPAEEVAALLLAAARDACPGGLWEPSQAIAHRWRYALPQASLPGSAYFDAAAKLGICGDWCGGPRVEGAALSGLALAEEVLRYLGI